ncbi:hypothetical protein B0H15DRAFT_953340 [Mycena belliarum]|uniref:DUF6534 domain-containing protein n=1 Tax=Mycena belliarum TaxID=1033014 RepID=A0AAD6U0L1_9AGAR|nr:hypothetical protein B0H15DRAFT_953340 [Mycena belliae]
MASPSYSFDVDGSLGALLIGVLISYVLFGVTAIQLYLYHGRFPNDTLRMKLLVAVVWFSELGHVICIGHMAYTMMVTNYAHPERLVNIPKSLGVSTLFNAIIASCVQVFFAIRIYRLSKLMSITIVAGSLSLLYFVATVALVVLGMDFSPFTQYVDQWGWLMDAAWAIAAMNDVIIAATLVFWLGRRREVSCDMTTAVVDKLITWSIDPFPPHARLANNGAKQFVTMPNNFVWIACYMVTTRLYTNSFLASLNSRTTLRTMNALNTLPLSVSYTGAAWHRSHESAKREDARNHLLVPLPRTHLHNVLFNDDEVAVR